MGWDEIKKRLGRERKENKAHRRQAHLQGIQWINSGIME